MKGDRKSRGWVIISPLTCSNRQTHTLSLCTVGSSHGKILHQSPKAVLHWSHGLTNQSGAGKPIQTVVSQVRGSVGTGGKKRGAEKNAPLFPWKSPSTSVCMQILSTKRFKKCIPQHNIKGYVAV